MQAVPTAALIPVEEYLALAEILAGVGAAD